MRLNRSFFTSVMVLSCLILIGCSGNDSGSSSAPSTAAPEGSEKVYNATPIGYSGSTITMTSTAQFERWNDYDTAAETGTGCTSLSPCKKGLVSRSILTIKHAEVQIYNTSTGTLVQAGETNATGGISMVIPRAAGNYRLEVHSRAFNSYLHASILDTPYSKNYYTLSLDFTVSGTESGSVALSLPTAPYEGTMEGAAFNILEDILIANNYLRAHANGNTTVGQADYCPASVCTSDFTVAPKVSVYWKKGLSPAAYFNQPTSPISFYVPKTGGGLYEGLYILGGIEGDICVDTDHYDNSVILHEYGHFLEKQFGTSDSPGGSHNGNKIIDPRLAWSEGWADFFQTAALGRSFYRDTVKNANCASSGSAGNVYTARLSFSDFQVETATTSQDQVTSIGEGNFREISVARLLYDTITGPTQPSPANVNADNSAADLGFAVVWNAFKSFTSSSMHGRSVGQFNGSLYSNLTTMGASYVNAWANDAYNDNTKPLTLEKQRRDLRDFGIPLTAHPAGSCSNTYGGPEWQITSAAPVADETNSAGQVTWSNMMHTNDFYSYYYDGTAAHATIKLKYKRLTTDVTAFANPWDLDLYVYKEDFVFLNSPDILKKSEGTYPETTGPYPGLETVSLSGLPAGFYFINVKVDYKDTDATRKAGAQYYFELGSGESLCP